jgi:hypothetical protein
MRMLALRFEVGCHSPIAVSRTSVRTKEPLNLRDSSHTLYMLKLHTARSGLLGKVLLPVADARLCSLTAFLDSIA